MSDHTTTDYPSCSEHSPHRKSRPYIFWGETRSLCEECLMLVPAKIVFEGNDVYYLKRCQKHGKQKTLISNDREYFLLCNSFLKPGDQPLKFQTQHNLGCPYDCGLCPDHEQHSCMALLEINQDCNLTCPTCFASSQPGLGGTLDLTQIEQMLDCLVESEGEPDLLQISGGEPSIHPQIIEVLKLAKTKPIRHLMINTNGIRIAEDKRFVEELALLKPGFEVYLQFDSLRDEALVELRGARLSRIREQALKNLEEAGISTTLVVVVKKGVNEKELGEIVDYALQWKCVRGVTFQPIQDCGRSESFQAQSHRINLGEIRRELIAQSHHYGEADLLPLPCNPHSICIGYGLRDGSRILPVTKLLSAEKLRDSTPNAITFEKYPEMQSAVMGFLKTSNMSNFDQVRLHQYLCCLPQFELPQNLSYENVFRVLIVQFMDRFSFCVGGVKRSCIHFVTPDLRLIPFETYNLFYRKKHGHFASEAKP